MDTFSYCSMTYIVSSVHLWRDATLLWMLSFSAHSMCSKTVSQLSKFLITHKNKECIQSSLFFIQFFTFTLFLFQVLRGADLQHKHQLFCFLNIFFCVPCPLDAGKQNNFFLHKILSRFSNISVFSGLLHCFITVTYKGQLSCHVCPTHDF